MVERERGRKGEIEGEREGERETKASPSLPLSSLSMPPHFKVWNPNTKTQLFVVVMLLLQLNLSPYLYLATKILSYWVPGRNFGSN